MKSRELSTAMEARGFGARPSRSAYLVVNMHAKDYLYGVGYSADRELIDLAKKFGIVDLAGSWYKYNGRSIGQGIPQTLNYLGEEVEVRDEIRRKVLEEIEENRRSK